MKKIKLLFSILASAIVISQLTACNSGASNTQVPNNTSKINQLKEYSMIITEDNIVMNKEALSAFFNNIVKLEFKQIIDNSKSFGIDENPEENYRRGQCGISSNAIHDYIANDSNQNMKQLVKKYEAHSHNGNHIYLKAGDNILIEPTYKQFILKNKFMDSNKYLITEINTLPDVFIGTKAELSELLSKIHKKFPTDTNSSIDFMKNYENEVYKN
ncbi:MAG: hypothetical protein PHC75_04195 [Burkholderiales bacterium]|nr:hypothetical protein [Burkholderiales bacterium]